MSYDYSNADIGKAMISYLSSKKEGTEGDESTLGALTNLTMETIVYNMLSSANDEYSFNYSQDELKSMAGEILSGNTGEANSEINTNGTGMFSGLSTIKSFDNNEAASKAYEDIYGGETLSAEDQVKYLNQIGINPSADGYTQTSTVDENGNETYFFYKTNADGSTEYLKVLEGTDGDAQLIQTTIPEGASSGTTNVYNHSYLKGKTGEITTNRADIKEQEAQAAQETSTAPAESEVSASAETFEPAAAETAAQTNSVSNISISSGNNNVSTVKSYISQMSQAASAEERESIFNEFIKYMKLSDLTAEDSDTLYNAMITQVMTSQNNEIAQNGPYYYQEKTITKEQVEAGKEYDEVDTNNRMGISIGTIIEFGERHNITQYDYESSNFSNSYNGERTEHGTNFNLSQTYGEGYVGNRLEDNSSELSTYYSLMGEYNSWWDETYNK